MLCLTGQSCSEANLSSPGVGGGGWKFSFFNLKDKNKNEGGQWKYSLGGIRGNNILQEILNNMAERMVDLSENFAEKMQ